LVSGPHGLPAGVDQSDAGVEVVLAQVFVEDVAGDSSGISGAVQDTIEPIAR
jgi:hypothetical protein